MKGVLTQVLWASTISGIANGAVIGRRQEPQDRTAFDQETTAFKEQGLCRFYRGDAFKSSSTCVDFCQADSEVGLVCETVVEGNGQTLDQVDPDGVGFSMGRCVCDHPFVPIANAVLEALPAVAAIGCRVLFNSFDLVLQLGAAAIPGAGQVGAGMSTAVRAAKTIAENGETAAGFIQWFTDPCNPDDNPEIEKYTAEVDKLFNPLSAVPDAVVPGAGCVIPDKRKCKDGDSNDRDENNGPDQNSQPPPPPSSNRPDPTSQPPPPPTSNRPDPTSQPAPPPSSNRPDPTSQPAPPPSSNRPDPSSQPGSQPSSDRPENDPSATRSDQRTTTTSYAQAATTAADLCRIDRGACQDFDNQPAVPPTPGDGSSDADTGDLDIAPRSLEERAKRQALQIPFQSGPFSVQSLPYPPQGTLFDGKRGSQVAQNTFDFSSTDLANLNFGPGSLPNKAERQRQDKWVTEHIVELQTMRDFITAATTGKLNSGANAKTPKIPEKFFVDSWNAASLPETVGNVGQADRRQGPRVPNVRVFEALGSNFNRGDFVLCEEGVNGIKALLWENKDPRNQRDFRAAVDKAAELREYDSTGKAPGQTAGAKDLVPEFMTHLRSTIGVYKYLNTPPVNTRLNNIISSVRTELSVIESHIPEGRGLSAMWDEFMADQLTRVENKGETWLRENIRYAEGKFNEAKRKFDAEEDRKNRQGGGRQGGGKTPTPQHLDFTIGTLKRYGGELTNLKIKRARTSRL